MAVGVLVLAAVGGAGVAVGGTAGALGLVVVGGALVAVAGKTGGLVGSTAEGALAVRLHPLSKSTDRRNNNRDSIHA
jgi:hypothetical protein